MQEGVCAGTRHCALEIWNLQSAAPHRDNVPVANESREPIQNNRTAKIEIDFFARNGELARSSNRRQNVKRSG
jgi:hypothetical protein